MWWCVWWLFVSFGWLHVTGIWIWSVVSLRVYPCKCQNAKHTPGCSYVSVSKCARHWSVCAVWVAFCSIWVWRCNLPNGQWENDDNHLQSDKASNLVLLYRFGLNHPIWGYHLVPYFQINQHLRRQLRPALRTGDLRRRPWHALLKRRWGAPCRAVHPAVSTSPSPYWAETSDNREEHRCWTQLGNCDSDPHFKNSQIFLDISWISLLSLLVFATSIYVFSTWCLDEFMVVS